GLCVFLCKDLAKSQKVTRLLRVRLVPQDGRKRLNRRGIIAATVLNETHVQPDSRHFWFELLGFSQQRDCPVPFLAAHTDHAKIGISGASTRVNRQHLTKSRFRRFEVSCLKRRLSFREPCLGIHSLLRNGRRRSGLRLYAASRCWPRANGPGNQREADRQNVFLFVAPPVI